MWGGYQYVLLLNYMLINVTIVIIKSNLIPNPMINQMHCISSWRILDQNGFVTKKLIENDQKMTLKKLNHVIHFSYI